MSAETIEIPLFPLGAVLFPGGQLPLRIFEPRYLRMVGECLRTATGFGAVLIREGQEAGPAATFHSIGTLATIEDFDQLADGLLGVTCRGGQRFEAITHRIQSDQLIVATVRPLIDDAPISLPSCYSAMKRYLQSLFEQERLGTWSTDHIADWDNGEWLGCRLIELLPFDLSNRQTLLAASAEKRLQILAELMKEHEMIAS